MRCQQDLSTSCDHAVAVSLTLFIGSKHLLSAGGAGETTEKLEAEFGERLQRLGSAGTPAELHSMLVDTVHMRVAAPYIPSAARTAHLLITAAINLVQVEVAPLPDKAALSPLAPLLAQQQVCLGCMLQYPGRQI